MNRVNEENKEILKNMKKYRMKLNIQLIQKT